ncbi:diguanylate cyclase [Erwinia persicina]|uniref:diguanylate cyclase n=1 Tax=Erwinia persicina TaxID=55211 RepID=UPI001F02A66A|nr:diguanylate cyclase [Erwinia persicina]
MYLFLVQGGGEFLIIIKDKSNTNLIIQDIHQSISKNCNDLMPVTVSIGVKKKQKNETSSHALSVADEALYKAKMAGRNCVIYAS